MKNKEELLEKYNKQFRFVRDLFIKNDIVGLIDGGAPEDEYDSQINKILSGVKNCKTEEELQELIVKIFSEIDEVNIKMSKKNANILWNYLVASQSLAEDCDVLIH